MTVINYDQLAADYAANRRVHPGVFAGLHAAIDRGMTVLEIGCGTGNYIGALHAATGATCSGIDPSTGMLAMARRRWPDVHFEQAPGEALPFAAAHFDFAFSVDVVHHLTDPAASLHEARRVLRLGGALCTVTDSARIIETRMPLSIYWPETVAVELARYHPIAQVQAWLYAAGFTTFREETVEHSYVLSDAAPYRARSYSALQLIDDAAFARGLTALEADLTQHGALLCTARYTLLWTS